MNGTCMFTFAVGNMKWIGIRGAVVLTEGKERSQVGEEDWTVGANAIKGERRKNQNETHIVDIKKIYNIYN